MVVLQAEQQLSVVILQAGAAEVDLGSSTVQALSGDSGQAQSLSISRSVNRRRTSTIICRNSRHSGAISLSMVHGSTVPVLRVRSCRKAPADSRGRRMGSALAL
jgi:hypothetical protein